MDTGTVSSERPATDAVGDAASLVTSVFCKDAPSSRSSQSTADPNKNATVGRGCGTSDSRKELYSNGDQRSQCRGSVCVLLSSEAHFFRSNTENETGGSGVSSRNYVAEAGVSFEALLAAQEAAVSCGYTLSFVTVSGNPPPISSFTDVENLKARLPHCSGTSDKHILEQQEALIHLIQTPQRLRSASADEFVCLLVPHHLGACLDLMHSASTAAFLEAFRNQNKPIGAIGHGIFAFFAKNKNGEAAKSFLRNYTIAAAPLVEEARYPYFGLLPVHLQLQLEADGAKMCSFSANSEWGSETTHSSSLVIDRNLVTAVADTSTKLVTLTILMLCRAEDRGPSAL